MGTSPRWSLLGLLGYLGLGWLTWSVSGAIPVTQLSNLAGDITTSINTPTDQFQWKINPRNPSARNVVLIFKSLTIVQAELKIYSADGSSLYSCISCGTMLPPPITSSGGNVLITISGVTGVSFTVSSFILEYVCSPTTYSSALNVIDIDLNMAYAKIAPVLTNGMLYANTNQTWRIRQPPGTKLTFSFSSFAFGADCGAATLTVYDRLVADAASVIFSGCRDADAPLYWFYSLSGQAMVVLSVGSGDVSGIAFQLTYYADNDLFNCGSFVQPDSLTDASMVLTDGSRSAALMRTNMQCAWRIQPSSGADVNLILSWVGLKFGSTMVVYDGSGPTSTALWTGTGATTTVPPVITSTKGVLYVQYQSDATNPIIYRGFFGSYYSNSRASVGSGSGNTLLAMSSALDITAPGDTLTHTPGIDYVWHIIPTGTTGPLTFSFSQLNLVNPQDVLVLYDGPTTNSSVLGTFSGTSLPTRWYKTTGPTASLAFASRRNASIADNGNFKLSYYADGPNFHCGFTTNPAAVTSQSMILTDGSRSVETIYPNQFCQWNVRPPGRPVAVYVFFSRFSVSAGSLSIYEMSVASRALFTTIADVTAVPAPILLPFGSVGLEYATRQAPSGYGFSLTYFGVSEGAVSSDSFPGDGTVRLYCSSMLSLVLALADRSNSGSTATAEGQVAATIAPHTNLTWILSPSASSGRIYFAFTSLSLLDCSAAYLDIYDGVDMATAPLIGRYCGSSGSTASLLAAYSWIQTSSAKALLNFVSGDRASTGDFELSFHSDGPNYHCGFAVNPATMTAPSMILTDGSASTESMLGGQYCEWLIQPQLPESSADSSSTSSSVNIVLEFLQCDLGGGHLVVYEGTSADEGNLLWECDGCAYVPRPIVSAAASLFITYATVVSATAAPNSFSGFGGGFQAVYWTLNSTNWRSSGSAFSVDAAATTEGDPLGGQLLELPLGFEMHGDVVNNSAIIELGTAAADDSETVSTLQFYPAYAVARSSSVASAQVLDGRRASQVLFESLTSPNSVCGVLYSGVGGGGGMTYVREGDSKRFQYTMTQSAERYLQTKSSYKSLLQLAGERNVSAVGVSAAFVAPSVCKYLLDTGSRFTSLAIQVNTLALTSVNGRLRIYGGVSGDDALLYDSNADAARDGLVAWLSADLIAPCGRSTIILEANATNTSTPLADYSLDLSYRNLRYQGYGVVLCDAYIQSLLPVAKKANPLIPYYIGGSAALSFLAFCAFLYYAGKRRKKLGYVFYPDQRNSRARKYMRVTPNHPRYSRKWDNFRNKFLSKGYCCVCKSISVSVYYLGCSHAVCVEDMEGYLEAALGDISQFPVKCPMHYESCTGTVGPHVAKRVLTEPQYTRFLEFSDRAVYGDGMRCIFCNNFVNFPDNMNSLARVECPYCVQLFCIRCKKPWHPTFRCMADKVDESLEVWKAASGAQKCPSCRKIIEKDDPETCHHMVHKITDGIPCVRDRTDFCYLCGEEVTSNYPHEEVKHPGVNHFPNGVFQKCRHVMLREKEEERERLKRARRMKAKSPVKLTMIVPVDGESWRNSPVGNGSPAGGSERMASPTVPLLFTTTRVEQQPPPPVAAPLAADNNNLQDRFDEQWNRALMEQHMNQQRSFQRHRFNTE